MLAQRVFTFLANLFARTSTTSSRVHLENVEGFKRAQRTAYDCVVQVSRQLKTGMTEIEAANLLSRYLAERGHTHYLHRPFAWFGEHSRFESYEASYNLFHPGSRALRETDIIILDVSPVVDGFIGDVGYTFSLGPNAELKEAKNFLLELREKIPVLFSTSKSLAEIWREVDELIRKRGYENCHAKYPLRVLGHRVYRIPKWMLLFKLPRVPLAIYGLSWFSPQGLLSFMKHGLIPEVMGPENKGPKSGLWAIEPHIGGRGFGAKFEEILLVDGTGKAAWIDDQVPHLETLNKSKS